VPTSDARYEENAGRKATGGSRKRTRVFYAPTRSDEGVVPCAAEATIETAAVQAVVAGVGEEAIARVSAEEPVAACPSS
jgi:hypothetical protein